MARISETLVVQFVDDRAVVVDDASGAEELIDLDKETLRELFTSTTEEGIDLGTITIPPESLLLFVFHLGYFFRSVGADA